MEKKIVLYTFLIFGFFCHSQVKIADDEAKIVFRDTINNFVFDSISNNLEKIPFSNGYSRLIKHFKYIGKDNIYIVKDWTQDPHFICNYPKGLLIPNKIYSYTICFYFNGSSPQMEKIMGFNFSNDISVTFKFYRKYNEPKERRVHGIVKDSIGGIPGVNVVVKGIRVSTQTDFDGKYEIVAKASDSLVFSFVAMKDKKIVADKTEINVVLEEMNIYNSLLGEIPRQIERPLKKVSAAIETILTKELIRTTTPRQYFNRYAKNNLYVIFVPNVYSLDEQEMSFQKKYNVLYLPADNKFRKYFKKCNKLVFRFLNEKYGKQWQNEIRVDALGVDKF